MTLSITLIYHHSSGADIPGIAGISQVIDPWIQSRARDPDFLLSYPIDLTHRHAESIDQVEIIRTAIPRDGDDRLIREWIRICLDLFPAQQLIIGYGVFARGILHIARAVNNAGVPIS